MAEQAKNWEDVKSYSLDEDAEQALFDAQIECTLIWASKDGWPMGVIVNYIHRDGRFWLTASEERPRVNQIRQDPRVCIAITSKGSAIKERQSLTYKCEATSTPTGRPWTGFCRSSLRPCGPASRRRPRRSGRCSTPPVASSSS